MKNGLTKRNEYFLIYAEWEGGQFITLGGWTVEKYKNLLKDKYFTNDYDPLNDPKKIYPAYAILVKSKYSWDFVLEDTYRKQFIDNL